MYKLKNISVKGYRRLQDMHIEMRDLTVMIGANGSGKTSFLDLLSLLSASANGKLRESLQVRGGFNEILTRGKANRLVIQLLTRNQENKPLDYLIGLCSKGISYGIYCEELKDFYPSKSETKDRFTYIDFDESDILYFHENSNEITKINWDYNSLETALSQVPKTFVTAESFRNFLASCTYYGALDISPRSPIRLPQAMYPATLPGAQGENLVSCLYNLRETDRSRFEMLENVLYAAFSDFEWLSFPPVAAGTISMLWKDKNFPQPFYIHELSEGTLRFLWLAALLLSNDLTAITLLDEPEVSLHPELLSHLVYLMREASKHTQLIVATHSDRLVRFLDPKEILVCDIEEGEARMTWADTFDLEKWLEDYTLDQVWAMNLIGGRP